jgi:hypothetical protein
VAQPPCPPLRNGLAQLHERLADRDWEDPLELLEELRAQAPTRLIRDLLLDLHRELHAADYWDEASQLLAAAGFLDQAAEVIGEIDYNPPTPSDRTPHPWNCSGHCGGTGTIIKVLTWDDGVPVHEEPVDCRAGVAEPEHEPNCRCAGTGRYRDEDGYQQLCLDRPDPVPEPSGHIPHPQPWADMDEPPF